MGCCRWVGTGEVPSADGAERSSALRAGTARVRAQLLSGVKGTPAGWTDSPIPTKKKKRKPVASNKDIIGR